MEADAGTGAISDSFKEFLKGWYPLLRLGFRYYREIGVPPEDEGPGIKNINETIDSSVFNRWRSDKGYRPPSLQGWAKRVGIDPAIITNSVRVDDLSVSVAE